MLNFWLWISPDAVTALDHQTNTGFPLPKTPQKVWKGLQDHQVQPLCSPLNNILKCHFQRFLISTSRDGDLRKILEERSWNHIWKGQSEEGSSEHISNAWSHQITPNYWGGREILLSLWDRSMILLHRVLSSRKSSRALGHGNGLWNIARNTWRTAGKTGWGWTGPFGTATAQPLWNYSFIL